MILMLPYRLTIQSSTLTVKQSSRYHLESFMSYNTVLNGEQHKTYAFKMLADFYFDEITDRYSKLYDFMAYFGIPMSLESSVLKNI